MATPPGVVVIMIRGGSVRKEELQIDRYRVEVPTDPGSWREDDEFGT
jgi:hypothetical protein